MTTEAGVGELCLGAMAGGSPSQPPEGVKPLDILDLDSCLRDCEVEKALLFGALVVIFCCSKMPFTHPLFACTALFRPVLLKLQCACPSPGLDADLAPWGCSTVAWTCGQHRLEPDVSPDTQERWNTGALQGGGKGQTWCGPVSCWLCSAVAGSSGSGLAARWACGGAGRAHPPKPRSTCVRFL